MRSVKNDFWEHVTREAELADEPSEEEMPAFWEEVVLDQAKMIMAQREVKA